MARDLVVRYVGDAEPLKQATPVVQAQLAAAGAAAAKMQRRFEAAAAGSGRSGAAAGKQLASGLLRAAAGQVVSRAGQAVGDAIYDKASARIGQSSLFNRFAKNAPKAGQDAGQAIGKKVAAGVEQRTSKIRWEALKSPKVVAVAVAAGLIFGRRFAQSAESSSSSRFNPSGLANKASGAGVLAGLSKVGGVAGGAAAILGGLGATGIGAGLSIAAGMETARISFTTMLGSGKRADKFLKDLQRFAASTPFEFPELQTAAASLVSAGINADKVIPIMRSLGDATAGMGTGSEGIQRATVALQQMSAAGRITGEDLNQLRDAGIPVYDLLASATGRSKAKVVELAQAGKLGKKELDQLLGALGSGKGLERFNGLMEKTSGSLSGMLSTLKDTAGQGIANAILPYFPAIKSGIKFLTDGLTNYFRFLSANQGQISRYFSDAGEVLKAFGGIAFAVFGGAGKGLVEGYMTTVIGFLDYLSTHQADIVSGFVSAGNTVIDFGEALVQLGVTGLNGFAALSTGLAGFVEGGTRALGDLIRAAVPLSFLLGPVVGVQFLKAAANFGAVEAGAARTAAGLRGAGDGARNMAGLLESTATPALQRTRDRLAEVGKQEVFKAAQRDQVARFSKATRDASAAVEGIGTQSDGSQVKLKRWSDVTNLGAKEQAGLRSRIDKARSALYEQVTAQGKAGGAQKDLTKTWETGKKRLYEEFLQMGLSKKEAGRLAEKYAGIKPKVSTKVSAPGMSDSQARAKDLAGKYGGLNRTKVETRVSQPGMGGALTNTARLQRAVNAITGKAVTISFATNASYKSAAGNAFKVNLSAPSGVGRSADGGTIAPGPGRGGPRDDRVLGIDPSTGAPTSWVSPLEEVVKAKSAGPNRAALKAINAGNGRRFEVRPVQRHAEGGTITTNVRGGGIDPLARAVSSLGAGVNRWAAQEAQRIGKAVGRQMADAAGASAGTIDVNNPRGRTSYRGGTFTNLFAANLRRAEKLGGFILRVMQGGFRPGTSYSGTSHRGDAVDSQNSDIVTRTLRRVGIASGNRAGLGNWAPHSHSVPTPGAGFGAGSAVWQAQDYKRRGGASQSLRSPWGLADGGTVPGLAGGGVVKSGSGGVTARVGEGRFDELVTPLPPGWNLTQQNGSMIAKLIRALVNPLRLIQANTKLSAAATSKANYENAKTVQPRQYLFDTTRRNIRAKVARNELREDVTALRKKASGTKGITQADRDLVKAEAALRRAELLVTVTADRRALAQQQYDQVAEKARAATDRQREAQAALNEQLQAVADQARATSEAFSSKYTGSALTDPADIIAQQNAGAAELMKFNSQIAALRKAGLNEASIRDIVDRGAAGGGDLATSILGSGKKIVEALNAAQKNLTGAADKLGMNVAVGTVRRSGGGWVFGPGTSTSDSIDMKASNGEFYVNAASARANAALLQQINSSSRPVAIRRNLGGPLQPGPTIVRTSPAPAGGGLSAADRDLLTGSRTIVEVAADSRGFTDLIRVTVRDELRKTKAAV